MATKSETTIISSIDILTAVISIQRLALFQKGTTYSILVLTTNNLRNKCQKNKVKLVMVVYFRNNKLVKVLFLSALLNTK